MATIVVGGTGKNAGKTSLICGILAALREFAWTAVKVTDHVHGKAESIWEEADAGQQTDTSRFLAAGARRAFLLSANAETLPGRIRELVAQLGSETELIFESNRIVDLIHADVVLVLDCRAQEVAPKPSFAGVEHLSHAWVGLAGQDQVISGPTPRFELASLLHISHEMQRWLRDHLPKAPGC